MSCYFLFSSYHNIKLHLSDKNISVLKLSLNSNSFYEVNLKVEVFFFGGGDIFLFTTIQRGNQATGQTSVYMGVHCIMQTLY